MAMGFGEVLKRRASSGGVSFGEVLTKRDGSNGMGFGKSQEVCLGLWGSSGGVWKVSRESTGDCGFRREEENLEQHVSGLG